VSWLVGHGWLVALALLATASIAAVARLASGYGRAPLQPSVMSAREQALLAAVADAFFPPGGPIPCSGTEAGALCYFDGYLRRSVPRQRLLMRLLLLFTELGPLLFGPRRARFTRLSQAERLLYLEESSQSERYFRRITFVSFRALMTMAYLSNDEVASVMRMRADTDPFALCQQATPHVPTESGVRNKTGARTDLAGEPRRASR
jgi:hypothetical protein